MPDDKKRLFRTRLFDWFATNHRPLPWKGVRDPYIIWLSEIILQQTTVQQGTPYFELFRERYPSVSNLAAAPDDDVMKLWEGLGYYSRARNLLATARYIESELNGLFPTTYEDILKLKGVGPYTAAAIASFAFGLPTAVVDGNVYRVLSRVFGIETPIDAPEARRIFTELATEILDHERPADFNQAMMDFGATHCTAANPRCAACNLQADCVAFQTGKVGILPIKLKKMVRRERFFNYLIINAGNSVFIRKRVERDIWQDLYEFPLIETDGLDKLNLVDLKSQINAPFDLIKKSQPFAQLLTHQRIVAVFWEIKMRNELENGFVLRGHDFLKIDRSTLPNFAFPKTIDTYFQAVRDKKNGQLDFQF